MVSALVAASAQDVIGKWKLEDGSAIVEVYQDGNVYNGKIVWLKNPTESDGTPAVDSNNPDTYRLEVKEGIMQDFRKADVRTIKTIE